MKKAKKKLILEQIKQAQQEFEQYEQKREDVTTKKAAPGEKA